MRSFLAASLSLSPFIGFWVLTSMGLPGAALAWALVCVSVVIVRRAGAGEIKILDVLAADFFLLIAVAYAMNWGWVLAHGMLASFLILAFVSLASPLFGRPWSADYAAPQCPQLVHTPSFMAANIGITLMWVPIFLAAAVLSGLGGDPRYLAALMVVGALASMLALIRLPRLAGPALAAPGRRSGRPSQRAQLRSLGMN